jgi:hypothetical protein
MNVFSSGSDRQNARMAAAARSAANALKIAGQPASGNRKPGLATRTSARPSFTLSFSTKNAEVRAVLGMSFESSYTVCISRRASGLQRRRFYAISAT